MNKDSFGFYTNSKLAQLSVHDGGRELGGSVAFIQFQAIPLCCYQVSNGVCKLYRSRSAIFLICSALAERSLILDRN